jgi:hypothetical protein
MEVVFDADVQAVAEFMQSKIPANRLVSVAEGLAQIAPLLWGQYQSERVQTLKLQWPAIFSSSDEAHTQPCAKGSPLALRNADGGSAAVVA